jgi:hypothetical protein
VPVADSPSPRSASASASKAAPSRSASASIRRIAWLRSTEQRTAAERDRLVGDRQRIAHRATRRSRQQAQRAGLGGDAFVSQHPRQMLAHRAHAHRPQVELQAARQHRRRHLLRIGGRQHELQILGRLFQRLQHRVERGVRQHVHFVDHVDLEATDHRLVDRLVEQRGDLLDAAVRRRIEFHVVDEAAGIDVAAGRADTARVRGDAALPVGAGAIERLGQDARHRGLAHAARAGEQVGMVQPALRQRIRQRLHHVLLAHQGVETARSVFAGQHQITHRTILEGRAGAAG